MMIFNGPFQLGCRYFIQLTVVGGPLGRKNQLISAVYLRIDSLLAKLLELPVQCMENPFAEKMSVVGHKVQSSKFKNQSKVQGPRSKVQKPSSKFQVQSSKFKNQSKVQGPRSKNTVQSFKFKNQSKVQKPSSKFQVQSSRNKSKLQIPNNFQIPNKEEAWKPQSRTGLLLLPSDFQLPASDFRLLASGFRPLTSGFLPYYL